MSMTIPITLTRQPIQCPHWHRPVLIVVPEGIEVRCKWCGGKQTQYIGREELERVWEQMKQVVTSATIDENSTGA